MNKTTEQTVAGFGAGQAETLSRILLNPGSAGMGIGFDAGKAGCADSMLMVGWHRQDGRDVARLKVMRGSECGPDLILSTTQADCLGGYIKGLGVIASFLTLLGVADNPADKRKSAPPGYYYPPGPGGPVRRRWM